MKRVETFGGSAAHVRVRVATQVARPAAREEEREGSRAAAWYWASAVVVLVWSVSYLVRQPGASATSLVQPFSPFGLSLIHI